MSYIPPELMIGSSQEWAFARSFLLGSLAFASRERRRPRYAWPERELRSPFFPRDRVSARDRRSCDPGARRAWVSVGAGLGLGARRRHGAADGGAARRAVDDRRLRFDQPQVVGVARGSRSDAEQLPA